MPSPAKRLPVAVLVLPCPFCGSVPVLMVYQYPRHAWIECHNPKCAVSPGSRGSTAFVAARRWNTRAKRPRYALLSPTQPKEPTP